MKIHLYFFVFVIVSCSSSQIDSSKQVDYYKLINDIHKKEKSVYLKPRSIKPYPKEVVLAKLDRFYPAFYSQLTNKEFERKKDSVVILKLDETATKNAIAAIEKKVFFKISDFLTDEDRKEFVESIPKGTIKWKPKALHGNIILSKEYNACGVSIPLFNESKTKALIFKECSSSEDFEVLKLNDKGDWEFVFSGNVKIY